MFGQNLREFVICKISLRRKAITIISTLYITCRFDVCVRVKRFHYTISRAEKYYIWSYPLLTIIGYTNKSARFLIISKGTFVLITKVYY